MCVPLVCVHDVCCAGETSPQALADPYNSDITLAYGFIALPFLQTVLTDTHFVERDRMGRMLTLMARVIHDQKLLPTPTGSPIRAVGVDAGTALLLNATTGLATIVGLGTAYVCTPSQIATVILPGQPLSFSGLMCMRLDVSRLDTYDFAQFRGTGVVYEQSIIAGVLQSLPYGPGGYAHSSTSVHE